MITHSVGLSLGPTSSVESGVAVREISTGKLIHVDKLFSMNDVNLFFNNYPSLKNSIICVIGGWSGSASTATNATLIYSVAANAVYSIEDTASLKI